MVAFILHWEYTTSCFMAKNIIWPNCQSSSNKEARQTFHCFVLNRHFLQLSECKYVVFVCLSVRLQVSFIPFRFRYFGRIFSFHTVNRSKESRQRPRKIIIMFLRQNRENLATQKYPIIRYSFARPLLLYMSRLKQEMEATQSNMAATEYFPRLTSIKFLSSPSYMLYKPHPSSPRIYWLVIVDGWSWWLSSE